MKSDLWIQHGSDERPWREQFHGRGWEPECSVETNELAKRGAEEAELLLKGAGI